MNSDQIFHLAAIVVYFVAMLAIGWYAYRHTTSHKDYLLGGRDLSPWAAALSAGAADMSGWLMMGLPGAIYVSGLVEGWIAVGLTVGAWLNWKVVAPRLRAYTEISGDSITIPTFLENRLRDRTHLLRIVTGLVILVFFTFYISSGMVAGGVFFRDSFGSSYLAGMLLVTGVTLAYTLFGGFLGVSLTDVVQGTLMMLALLVVPVIAVVRLGGPGETIARLEQIAPDHLSALGGSALTGAATLTIVSALGWGLGYFGQPHIITRFMAMRDVAQASSARRIGIAWMLLSMGGAVSGGLIGLVWFTETGQPLDDPETVMLAMSRVLLHPIVAGLVLAAVLAAIMSTISSQLIVCSSALVEDLYRIVARRQPPVRRLMALGRGAVLLVAVIAALLALDPQDSILGLVSFAWAGFGAAFGPIVLLALFWRRLTAWGALSGMTVGAVLVFVWSALDTGLYEIIPAFAANLVVAVLVSLATARTRGADRAVIDDEFDRTVAVVHGRSTGRGGAAGDDAGDALAGIPGTASDTAALG
ncbi:MAG: sodium/proline symporter PutP [Pseudoclavibacter caeni]